MSRPRVQITLRPGKDGLVVAEVPGIPGCQSKASSVAEALAAIREMTREQASTLKQN